MARFNIQVAIQLSGESGKAVANAFRQMAGNVEKSLGKVDRAAKMVSLAIRGIAAAAVTRQLLQTITAYEQLRAQLETITGSAGKAEVAFAGIQQLAAKTPFSVESLTSAFIKLGAQGIAPTEARLLSYGNTAAAMGKDVMQFIEAVADAQVGEFERLKEFGIKARTEGDKVAFTFRGVTTSVQKDTASIVSYLDDIGSKDFAGAMDRQAKTLGGAWSNLKDSASQLADQVGQGGLASALQNVAREFSHAGDESAEFGRTLGMVLGSIVDGARISSRVLLGLVGSAFIVGEAVGRAFTQMHAKMVEFTIKAAELVGLDDVAAKGRAALGELQHTIRQQSGLIDKSLLFTAQSFAGVGDAADDMMRRFDEFTSAGGQAVGTFDEIAGGLDKTTAAAEKAGKAVKELTQSFIAPLDTARESPLAGYFGEAEKSAARIGALLSELGVRTRDWAAEADMVRKAYADGLITLEEMNAALGRIGNLSVDWGDAKPDENTLSAINQGFKEAVGKGLHDAAVGFFGEMTDGLTDGLPSSVKPLADALVSAANEWLAQMLANIAKAAAAATAAKIGEGGKGGGQGWGSTFMSALGMGGGSGGAAMSGAAVGGLAFAAVAVAALAIMKHQSDQRDKRRYGTNVQMRTEDGSFQTYMGGRLQETGGKMRDAMVQLAAALQDSTRTLLDGTNNAVISIRNDKKAFIAKLNGELIGVFQTANEAVIAVVKEQFLRQGTLDPVIRQVMQNFRGDDPEQLAANVQYVQDIIDSVSGLTEMEATLQKIPGQIAAMVGNLKQMGVALGDAAVLAGRWGVEQFRGAWEQISGHQRSPKEEREMRERQKALLLAQMALEKARLAGEISTLKARMKIAAAGTQFQQRDLAARIHLVKWEANALRNGLDIYGQYVDGRAQIAMVEAKVYDEQLAALELVMRELEKLMGEVERGKIRINAGGRPGLGDVDLPRGGGRVGGGRRAEREQFLDAWKEALKTLRDWVNGLKLSSLSPLTPQQRLAEAQAQVAAAIQAIAGGGQTGLEALQNLPHLLESLLGEAGNIYGTSTAGYQQIFAQVQALVASVLAGDLPENVRRQIEAILGGGQLPANTNTPGNGAPIRIEIAPIVNRLDLANQYLLAIRNHSRDTATGVHELVQLNRQRVAAA